jgi:anaerobic selenocysteine-containing dehydrogenase
VNLEAIGARVSAARADTLARGETFYPGASRVHLAAFPPKERWDDWSYLDSKRVGRRTMLAPTTCFNCESACGLLAYIDRDTLTVRKFEGNPEHPGSRGRNCAKGPATLNQVTDPDRILFPLKRVGERGEGRWVQVSWDEALDDVAARIRAALAAGRPNEIMYHVGRPGEDGFTERVLASWGVDGHNSHTNVCSSGARAGYHFWMGIDRPSPDHAGADVILLVSAHLESGHYFNPHAQRITDAKARDAKVIVFDTRLSNTATHADQWLAPHPGSEAAILLAVANHLIQTGRFNREFVRRWWNWAEYLASVHPGTEVTFERFEEILRGLYAGYTFEFAAAESGVDAAVIAEVAEVVAGAGTRLATHSWRSAAAGNLGGWQVSRCLFLLNCLLGAVATEGGTYPNAWNKFVPRPIHTPGHPHTWNELTWPAEFPLALNEMSFLLPHFMKEGRGRLAVYFTRVYNPVWTNPDGLSWMEVLTDPSLVGVHVALTPVWNETAYFADYILPMGVGSERHDLHSYEQYDGQWIGFRQNVVPVATPDGDGDGRRPAGVRVEGVIRRGFPTPSGRLEFWSRTLAEWGWPEHALPGYIRSHVHPAALAPDEMVLISTFRLPTQIHTRGGNAKWLNELAHTNPLWIHPRDARRLGIETGGLVRVETGIGYFVVKAWVTEGIRPRVVACSHHMGRWKLASAGDWGQSVPDAAGGSGQDAAGPRQVAATVDLTADGGRWGMRRRHGVRPYTSADPDTRRIWWGDVGVHQNLAFPVHPDPVSGQHCWHQAVRVRPAADGDAYGDIAVDTGKAHQAYQAWLRRCRGAADHSPDGTRRPYWLLRPLKPGKDAYRLTEEPVVHAQP